MVLGILIDIPGVVHTLTRQYVAYRQHRCHAIGPEFLIEDAPNLDLQRGICLARADSVAGSRQDLVGLPKLAVLVLPLKGLHSLSAMPVGTPGPLPAVDLGRLHPAMQRRKHAA